MTKFISKTVNVFFVMLVGLIVLSLSQNITESLLSGSTAFIAALLLIAFVILGLIIFNKPLHKIYDSIHKKISKISPLKLALILGAFTLITKLFFVILFNNDANCHPDMKMYLSFANQLAQDGKIIEYTDYAQRYIYTVMFSFVLSPFAKIFGSSTIALTSGLTIFTAITNMLLFDILRKYVNKTKAFLGLMIYNIVPQGLFQTQLLIHETAALFFHILSLWLLLYFFTAENKKNIKPVLSFIFSLISLALSISVNNGGLIIAASYVIFLFYNLFQNGYNLKKWINFFGFCVLILIVIKGNSMFNSFIVKNYVEGESYKNNSFEISKAWRLYLGSNYEKKGIWNQEDYDTFYKFRDFDTKQEAHDYQKQIISERYSEYFSNPLKFASHLYNKFKELWGTTYLPFIYEQGNSISQFIHFWNHSIIYRLLYMSNSLAFIAVYLIVLISQFSKKKSTSISKFNPSIHFKMVPIAVTLVLLLLEVQAKYASHMHILLFSICILQFSDFSTSISKITNKFKKLNK